MARNVEYRKFSGSDPEDLGEKTVIVPPKPLNLFQKILRALHITSETGVYLGIVLFLIIGGIVAQSIIYWQTTRTKAGTNTIKISVQPATSTMPPNTTYQVWATADNPVAFMTLKIIFDPKLVKLIGEISTSPSPLTRIVKQTAMSEANTTGIINLSLALDPTRRSSPPTGTFQLAAIQLSPNTTQQMATASMHLDGTAMQVVNPDTTLFTVTTADANISLNPPPTPTPTPKPTATPTTVPTPTVSPAPAQATSIINIRTGSISASQGTVIWKTTTPTIGWVIFGTSSAGLNGQTTKETAAGTNHTATITGLSPNTWVYYQIAAQDSSGASVQSSVQRFKTKGK